MRYHQLLESNNIYNEIVKHGEPLFRNNVTLYRGFKRDDNDPTDAFLTNVRKDRSPMDTNKILHHVLDKYFFDKFGIYARSQTVFVSTSDRQAREYGNLAAVIPKGKFTLIYSSAVKDLFNIVTWRIKKNDILKVEIKNPIVFELLEIQDYNVSLNFLCKMIEDKLNSSSNIPDDINNDIYNLVKYILDPLNYKASNNVSSIATMSKNVDFEIMVYCEQYFLVPDMSIEGSKLNAEYNNYIS